MIKKYKYAVKNFPVGEQGELSKISTWKKFYSFHDDFKKFVFKYETSGNIWFSRDDIFTICEQNITEGLFAAEIWGYPSGPRGNNFKGILENIGEIKKRISFNKVLLESDFCALLEIPGLGISTLSKFLYFFRCKINGNTCLIFDKVMNDICAGAVFGPDFHQDMGTIKNYIDNPKKYYPLYLQAMSKIANQLNVSGEKLEGFLFMVGRNIKPTNNYDEP